MNSLLNLGKQQSYLLVLEYVNYLPSKDSVSTPINEYYFLLLVNFKEVAILEIEIQRYSLKSQYCDLNYEKSLLCFFHVRGRCHNSTDESKESLPMRVSQVGNAHSATDHKSATGSVGACPLQVQRHGHRGYQRLCSDVLLVKTLDVGAP